MKFGFLDSLLGRKAAAPAAKETELLKAARKEVEAALGERFMDFANGGYYSYDNVALIAEKPVKPLSASDYALTEPSTLEKEPGYRGRKGTSYPEKYFRVPYSAFYLPNKEYPAVFRLKSGAYLSVAPRITPY
jgi:hypothetical protein